LAPNPSDPTTRAKIMESHKRSIAKALSYRFLGTIVTIIVAYLVTGEKFDSLLVGLGDSAAKVFAFYFHERMWMRIGFGVPKPPDYQI